MTTRSVVHLGTLNASARGLDAPADVEAVTSQTAVFEVDSVGLRCRGLVPGRRLRLTADPHPGSIVSGSGTPVLSITGACGRQTRASITPPARAARAISGQALSTVNLGAARGTGTATKS